MAGSQLDLQLTKNSGISGHAKWLRKQIGKDESSPTCAMAAYRPQIAKVVYSYVRKHLEPLLSKVALPSEHEALRDEIFNPQAWSICEEHTQINVLPYGCTEVRYLCQGSYMVAGVQLSALSGDSMKDKLDKLQSDSGMKNLLQKAKEPEAGFWVVHDEPNTALIIPAGYLVIVTGNYNKAKEEDGANGMRWSFLDAASNDEVKLCSDLVGGMLDTFPELKVGDYKAWDSCLKQFLLPASDVAQA